MAYQQPHPAQHKSLESTLHQLGRRVLLVPEAPLIVLLTSTSVVLNGSPLIGLLIATLIIGFSIRVSALYLARAALAEARYPEAAALLQVAQTIHPWSADTLALRGALANAMGEPEVAVDALQRSIHLLPERAETHALLSGAFLALGQASMARGAARTALALNPSCTIAHLYLAEAEHTIGLTAHEVEDRLRAGLSLATTADDEGALRCALAAHLLSEQRMAESALVLGGMDKLLLRCTPASQLRLRIGYGELLMAQGQYERAHEYLHYVTLVEPVENPQAMLRTEAHR